MRSTVEGTRRASRVFASAAAIGLVLSGGMITVSNAASAATNPHAKACAAKYPGASTTAKKQRASCVKKLKARTVETPPEDTTPTDGPSPTETPTVPVDETTQTTDTTTTNDNDSGAGAGSGAGASGEGDGTGAGTGTGGDSDANATNGNNDNTNVNGGNDSDNDNTNVAGGGGGGDANNTNTNGATGGDATNNNTSNNTNTSVNGNNNNSSSSVSNSGNSSNNIVASGVGNPTAVAYGGAGSSSGPINVYVTLPPMTVNVPVSALPQTTALPEAATRSVVTAARASRTVNVPARAGMAPTAWTRANQAARLAITGLPTGSWQIRVQDQGAWRTLGMRSTTDGKVVTPGMRMLKPGSYLLKLDRLRGTDYYVIVQVR